MNEKKKYLASSKSVPPSGDISSPIWIVGDAPGAQEVVDGKPFTGKSGEFFDSILSTYKISSPFKTYVSPFRPISNDFSKLFSDKRQKSPHPELISGMADLILKIKSHKPKLILAVGAFPFKFLTPPNVKGSIYACRGSVYPCVFDPSIQVMGIYSPSYTMRDPSNYPLFDHDIEKASRILDGSFRLPAHSISHNPPLESINHYFSSPYLAIDIETVKGTAIILTISFAISSKESIVFQLKGKPENREIVQLLLDSPAQKIFHFGSFDVSVLEYNGYRVLNYTQDTIIASHILFPEFPRSLDFLASLFTDVNYYKKSGRDTIPSDEKGWSEKHDIKDLMNYNGTDTVVTFEVWEKLMELINEDPDFKRFYEYEMKLVHATIKMGHLGMLRDEPLRQKMLTSIDKEIETHTNKMNLSLGNVKINPNSPAQVQTTIYKHFKLPVQTKKTPAGIRPTTDNDALVNLISICHEKIHLGKENPTTYIIARVFLEALVRLRELNKMKSSQLEVLVSRDGRVKSLYKVAGTETGRLSANSYIDGTGMNSQTITRDGIEIKEEEG